MSDKIQRLKESILRDEQRVVKLQEEIKGKKERLKEMENTELLNNLNTLTGNGVEVDSIISAIKSHDIDSLIALMDTNASEKGGVKIE